MTEAMCNLIEACRQIEPARREMARAMTFYKQGSFQVALAISCFEGALNAIHHCLIMVDKEKNDGL